MIIERERKQSSGGRLDFLFLDPETQTMYETEIMLGDTDILIGINTLNSY